MDPGPPLVLLAEDDGCLRRLISSHLTRAGMKVIEVEDGEELHDYLVAAAPRGSLPNPDIIISDVDMPVATGPEAIERANHRQAPVVLITARATPEVREAAAQVGAAELLEKPFEFKRLMRMIRQLVPPAGQS